jgi:hypothetical protein
MDQAQIVQICLPQQASAKEPEHAHIGGSARGYLAVGGASQQSRYDLLDGRLFCIFQPVAQTPIKAPASQDLGLLGCGTSKYGGRVDPRAIYATGWFIHRHPWGECPHLPLRELIDCAEERLTGDELVDVAIRSPEVLPGRSWFA